MTAVKNSSLSYSDDSAERDELLERGSLESLGVEDAGISSGDFKLVKVG
jgi:hypothetical protein